MGFVLQRGDLCFHAMFSQAWSGRTLLLRAWLLGTAVAAVGLSLLFLLPLGADLNRGLAFRPVGNIVGGLLIGTGMTVARACVSGLFHRLGAGMIGASVGLLGWGVGELAASRLPMPGPVVLGGGDAATIPGILGLPRLLVALVVLAVAAAATSIALRRGRAATPDSSTWTWPVLGLALGAATITGWALAGAGGASYGPSTVGAVAGSVEGRPPWWLIGFLLALVLGGFVAARTSGTLWVRGETRVRYGGLAAGGLLLGAGGWWAGGCNLGHGISGVAQLNVSSWVVVVAMAVGLRLSAGLVGRARSAVE